MARIRMTSLAAGLLVAACGKVTTPPATDAPVETDGPAPDAPDTARCDPSKPFGAATLMRNINSPDDESAFGLSEDELTAFVTNVIQPPNLEVRILSALRTSVDDDFGALTNGLTSALNAVAGQEYGGSVTADGRALYFHRQQPSGAIGIVAATRGSTAEPFDAGAAVRVNNTVLGNALSATISADGQTLYWLDFGDFTIRTATRMGSPTTFGPSTRITSFGILNPPVLSADELTLFYNLGTTADDVHVTTRVSKADPFPAGVPIPNVNSPSSDAPAALTRDGCILYITSNRPGGVGGFDIWEARRPR
jgi:hypothetical protein